MHCKGLAGRLFSHNFRPVFDTAAVDTAAVGTAAIGTASVSTAPVSTAPPKGQALAAEFSHDARNFVRTLSLAGDRFYNGHVCARCGYKIIKEL
ncbi:hypothetical protein DBL07_23765 [Achromobacter mucicolens]|uniref:hypothetical protein n=1 Tax=Achromobacter mucicolens TaxID=1389922 RepID=UPI000D4FF6B8|nr:hypothetical protein [Achromobacter mucicolens]PTW85931.1 hypothetical protein DBL07_23765 [Achromobacter mucicolens]